MLDAAQALVLEGPFRLWILEVQGRAACAQLLVIAGTEAAFWGGGFDADFGKLSPGIVTLAGAVEDCFQRGEQRLDLGGGAQPYKLRFADGEGARSLEHALRARRSLPGHAGACAPPTHTLAGAGGSPAPRARDTPPPHAANPSPGT